MLVSTCTSTFVVSSFGCCAQGDRKRKRRHRSSKKRRPQYGPPVIVIKAGGSSKHRKVRCFSCSARQGCSSLPLGLLVIFPASPWPSTVSWGILQHKRKRSDSTDSDDSELEPGAQPKDGCDVWSYSGVGVFETLIRPVLLRLQWQGWEEVVEAAAEEARQEAAQAEEA